MARKPRASGSALAVLEDKSNVTVQEVAPSSSSSSTGDDKLDEMISAVTPNNSAITRMINSVLNMAARARNAQAVLFASCVEHAILHGNATPMVKGILALGPTGNGQSVSKWATTLGPFTYGKDPDTKQDTLRYSHAFVKKLAERSIVTISDDEHKKVEWASPDHRIAFIRTLIETPYWVLTPPASPFKALDARVLLVNLAKKLVKAQDDPEIANDKRNDLTAAPEIIALAKRLAPSKMAA